MKPISKILVKFSLICALAGIMSCAEKDESSQYIGFYKFKNSWSGEDGIMKIVEDNKSLLMYDGTGKVIPLERTQDGLKAQDQLMTISSDGSVLYFSGQELPRVTEEYAINFVAEQERAEKLCKDLDAEAAEKSKEIKNTNTWNKYVEELAQRKPENCRLINDGKRYGF